jgi:hypothetical protein
MSGILAKRSPRRQRLAAHLHACGPRPMFEAMLALEAGEALDDVLAAYGRLPVRVYHIMGADRLDLEPPLTAVQGGRR